MSRSCSLTPCLAVPAVSAVVAGQCAADRVSRRATFATDIAPFQRYEFSAGPKALEAFAMTGSDMEGQSLTPYS